MVALILILAFAAVITAQPPPPPQSLEECFARLDEGPPPDKQEFGSCLRQAAPGCANSQMEQLHSEKNQAFANCVRLNSNQCNLNGNPHREMIDAITNPAAKTCFLEHMAHKGKGKGPMMTQRVKRSPHGGPGRCFKDFCPKAVLEQCKNDPGVLNAENQIHQAMRDECNCLTNNNPVCQRMGEED